MKSGLIRSMVSYVFYPKIYNRLSIRKNLKSGKVKVTKEGIFGNYKYEKWIRIGEGTALPCSKLTQIFFLNKAKCLS